MKLYLDLIGKIKSLDQQQRRDIKWVTIYNSFSDQFLAHKDEISGLSVNYWQFAFKHSQQITDMDHIET